MEISTIRREKKPLVVTKNDANIHKEVRARDGKRSISPEASGSSSACDQQLPRPFSWVHGLVVQPPLDSMSQQTSFLL